MVVGSRLGFGVTTVALVALASTGTAVLVSHGTSQLRVPGYQAAPRTPQALPGVGAPVVVPRVPGTLVLPPPLLSVPVRLPVHLPVVAPPQGPSQAPVVPAPPVVTPPVVTPPVVSPPVIVPPVVAPPVLPPPPILDPHITRSHKAHHNKGKHLGQLKH